MRCAEALECICSLFKIELLLGGQKITQVQMSKNFREVEGDI